MMQALLLARDDGSRAWLQGALGDRVTILPADARTGEECIAEVANTPDVTLAFVQFDDKSSAARAAIVEALSAAYPELPIVAIGDQDSGDTVLIAMRAGARDFFVPGRDDDRLATLLTRVLERRPRARQTSERNHAAGRLVTVMSSPQSPLLAFLAGHMAFVLQASCEQGQRVLLFDLSLPGGNAGIMFDGAHDYTALDILRDVERCDETLVESAFQRLDNGVYLLGLPEDYQGHDLAAEAADLGRLLDIFQQLFDFVLICVDGGLGTHAVGELLTRSEHALLLSDQSVLRSRQNRALLQDMRGRGQDLQRLKLIIGNHRTDIGLEPERLAQLLELPLGATLSGRPATRLRAMNAGESIFEYAPSDHFARDVNLLVQQVLGVTTKHDRKRFGLRRLFGRGD